MGVNHYSDKTLTDQLAQTLYRDLKAAAWAAFPQATVLITGPTFRTDSEVEARRRLWLNNAANSVFDIDYVPLNTKPSDLLEKVHLKPLAMNQLVAAWKNTIFSFLDLRMNRRHGHLK